MANFGKFKDRSPKIRPAGLPSRGAVVKAADCLKDYRLESAVQVSQHKAGIFEEEKPAFKYNFTKIPCKHHGIFTEIRPILQEQAKTGYHSLINDLKETSYRNKLEGKGRDPLPGLPASIDPLQTTFGKLTAKSTPTSDVLQNVTLKISNNPTACKTIPSAKEWSEKRDRKYLKSSFDPYKRYGERFGCDPRGIQVKCACSWHIPEPIRVTNKIEADVNLHPKHELGKVYAPNDNLGCVTKGHMFGKPSNRPIIGVGELIRDANVPPCVFKSDFYMWMKYLKEIRVFLKNRSNKYNFSLSDFHDHIMYYDKEHTGWVALDLFYSLCECYKVHYEHKCMKPFFDLYDVIKDGMINYRDFLYLVNINNPLPEIIKIEDVPKNNQYYVSEAKAASCDYLIIDNSKLCKAGIPTNRFDIPNTHRPPGGCLADIENLGDETTPRKPDQIKKIFENIGYEFSEGTFEKLWSIGKERDKSELVCVKTFKNLLNE